MSRSGARNTTTSLISATSAASARRSSTISEGVDRKMRISRGTSPCLRRVDDLRLAPGKLGHQLDHVLRAAGPVARLAVPYRDERCPPQSHRQRAVEDPPVATGVDADALGSRTHLVGNHENRRPRVALDPAEALLLAISAT